MSDRAIKLTAVLVVSVLLVLAFACGYAVALLRSKSRVAASEKAPAKARAVSIPILSCPELALGEPVLQEGLELSLLRYEETSVCPTGGKAPEGSKLVILWLHVENVSDDRRSLPPLLLFKLLHEGEELGRNAAADPCWYDEQSWNQLWVDGGKRELWPGGKHTGWEPFLVPQATPVEELVVEASAPWGCVGRWHLEGE